MIVCCDEGWSGCDERANNIIRYSIPEPVVGDSTTDDSEVVNILRQVWEKADLNHITNVKRSPKQTATN